MSLVPNNTFKWIAGLVFVGVFVYMVNQALGLPSRVAVLENEKANIWRKLDEISEQNKEMKRQLDRIERNTKP